MNYDNIYKHTRIIQYSEHCSKYQINIYFSDLYNLGNLLLKTDSGSLSCTYY